MGRNPVIIIVGLIVFIAGVSRCSYSCAKIGACEQLCSPLKFALEDNDKCMCLYSHGWEPREEIK